MGGNARWVYAGLLVPLLALAIWLRVTSLAALPETNGDEAWHAIQLSKMLRGKPFAVRTEHGLPLSSLHAALEGRGERREGNRRSGRADQAVRGCQVLS